MRRRILVHAVENETRVRVTVEPGVPQTEEASFYFDGDRDQARRDAADKAKEIAVRYHCRWDTNY